MEQRQCNISLRLGWALWGWISDDLLYLIDGSISLA
jgi:hypothetical protein